MHPPPSEADLDLEVFEHAARRLEQGELLERAQLLQAFPGREAQVERVLAAVSDYRRLLAEERTRRAAVPGADLLAAGSVLGDYTIIAPLGRGNMGVVYRARQTSLGDREVALKLLPASLAAQDPRFVERFRREAELAAGVHHARVAEVYGFGSEGDQLFFAMRLVEGRSLAEVLSGLALQKQLGRVRHLDAAHVRRVVHLVRELADGLAAVHAAGLVHRDVTPSNVMLERADEDPLAALESLPVLVDFGLIRSRSGSELTGSRTLLGTRAFASPEAQLGREVGAAGDVFSVGVILHDLLASTAAGLRGPGSSGLVPVRAQNPAVDERLAAILEMALQQDPALRYADGTELRDELDRYLRSQPIRSLPESGLGRLRLWMRRHPTRSARALALGGGGLIAGAALMLWFGFYVLPIYSGARHGMRLHAAGDFVGARRELGTVHELSLSAHLPLLGPARRLAARYFPEGDSADAADAAFAQACAGIGDSSRAALHAAHELLDQLLRTPDGHWPGRREAIASFLTRELRLGPSRERRELAAMTLASHLLLESDLTGGGHPAESWQDQLHQALRSVVDEGLAAAPEERERLYNTLAALGGIGDRSDFDRAQERLLDPDPEIRRLATIAAVRIWHSHRDEFLAEDPSWMGEFLEKLWSSARLLLASRRQPALSTPAPAGRPPSARRVALDAHYFSLCWIAGAHGLHCLAWNSMQLELAGRARTLVAPSTPAELVEHVEELTRMFLSCQRAKRTSREAIEARACEHAPIRAEDGQPLGKAEIDNWSAALCEPEAEYERWARDEWLFPYGSLTSDQSESAPETVTETVTSVNPDPDRSAPLAEFAFPMPGPQPWGGALEFEFEGTIECQGGPLIQLAEPTNRIRLVSAIPPDARAAAHVRITHECPQRTPLPFTGSCLLRIDACNGSVVHTCEVGVGKRMIEFSIPWRSLVEQPELELEIQREHGPGRYWFRGATITFGPERER